MQVDIDKSIDSCRLCLLNQPKDLSNFFSGFLNLVIFLFLIIFPIVIATLDIVVSPMEKFLVSAAVFVVFFIPGLIFGYGIVYAKKLIRITGTPDELQNQQAIGDFLKARYSKSSRSKFTIHENKSVTIAEDAFEKEFLGHFHGYTLHVVVLFRNQDIYLNFYLMDAGGAHKPFYTLFYHVLIRRTIRELFWQF